MRGFVLGIRPKRPAKELQEIRTSILAVVNQAL